MKTITALVAILALSACAGPGSKLAGIGADEGAPHGCGFLDEYTPETGTLDSRFTSNLTADAHADSVCDMEHRRATELSRQIESKARVETMPAE